MQLQADGKGMSLDAMFYDSEQRNDIDAQSLKGRGQMPQTAPMVDWIIRTGRHNKAN